jgi:hypothetical protein
MELDISHLYADKTWVQIGTGLGGSLRRELLESAKEYAESLAIPELTCSLEKSGSGRFLGWGANKALVLQADFKPYAFRGIFTLNSFAETCVLGIYKLLTGDSFFVVNQSAEVRRRAVVDKLKHLDTLDYFFMVDKVVDQVGEFLQGAVKEVLSSPD